MGQENIFQARHYDTTPASSIFIIFHAWFGIKFRSHHLIFVARGDSGNMFWIYVALNLKKSGVIYIADILGSTPRGTRISKLFELWFRRGSFFGEDGISPK